MNLYRELLIDIIQYLRRRNGDQNEYEPELGAYDRYMLTANYQIGNKLIDAIFWILQGQIIKFNPKLRSSKEFKDAKQQISTLESSQSQHFNPNISKKEILQLNNLIIREIFLDQEQVQQSPLRSQNPHQTLLFIHLMIVCFPAILNNNSILSKRKEVLLKLFGQQTCSYLRSKQANSSVSKSNNVSQTEISVQGLTYNLSLCDYTISKVLKIRSNSQEAPRTRKFNLNRQQEINFKVQKRFYFRSSCPLQIEQVSTRKIRIQQTLQKYYVHSWSQLDLPSYLVLKTTDEKVFNCWTAMLKLLNHQFFKDFINYQIRSIDYDYEGINWQHELLIQNEVPLGNIIKLDQRKSIIKIHNSVMMFEHNILDQNLEQAKEEIGTLRKLLMTRDYVNLQIEQIQRSITTKDSKDLYHKSEPEQIKDQHQTPEQIQSHSDQQPPDQSQISLIKQPEITESNQNLQMCSILEQYTYSEGQHRGYWIFDEQYPIKIHIMSKQKLLMTMKNNRNIIIEWWQFNLDSLNALLVGKVNQQAAQVWTILLMLIDQDQFYKLWNREIHEYIIIAKEEDQLSEEHKNIPQVQHSDQFANSNLKPEIIIQSDYYRLILKFRTHVQIVTQIEFDEYKKATQITEFEFNEWKIQNRKTYYKQLMRDLQSRKSEEELCRLLQINGVAPTQEILNQKLNCPSSKLVANTELLQIYKGRWLFDEDYPVRIDNIDKECLKMMFKDKRKNCSITWQQFEYSSLKRLIFDKINIQAGEVWTIMFILLDHDQFYRLWRGDFDLNNCKLESESENFQRYEFQMIHHQEQVQTERRPPPDYIPQKLIRLDNARLIVKFRDYLKIFTDNEFTEFKNVVEIPSESNYLKCHLRKSFYNQNIKALQQRLKLELQNEQN